jgi:hypothetical protein
MMVLLFAVFWGGGVRGGFVCCRLAICDFRGADSPGRVGGISHSFVPRIALISDSPIKE